MRVPFLLWRGFLDSPAARTRKWVCVARQVSAERKHICATISDMYDRGLGRKARLRASLGASTHPFPVHARCRRQAPRLSCRSWLTRHPGSCIAQPTTSPLDGRTASTGGQVQPSSSLIAVPLPSPGFGMMGEVHLGGILYQQHSRFGRNLFARLLPMRLHQRDLRSHRLPWEVGTRPPSLSRSARGRARWPGYSRPCVSPLSRLVLCDK